jgi:hypothetical protein
MVVVILTHQTSDRSKKCKIEAATQNFATITVTKISECTAN